MAAEILVKINKNGDVTTVVKGVKGPGCEEMTKDLEEMLGTVESVTHTTEYYEVPVGITSPLKIKTRSWREVETQIDKDLEIDDGDEV